MEDLAVTIYRSYPDTTVASPSSLPAPPPSLRLEASPTSSYYARHANRPYVCPLDNAPSSRINTILRRLNNYQNAMQVNTHAPAERLSIRHFCWLVPRLLRQKASHWAIIFESHLRVSGHSGLRFLRYKLFGGSHCGVQVIHELKLGSFLGAPNLPFKSSRISILVFRVVLTVETTFNRSSLFWNLQNCQNSQGIWEFKFGRFFRLPNLHFKPVRTRSCQNTLRVSSYLGVESSPEK